LSLILIRSSAAPKRSAMSRILRVDIPDGSRVLVTSDVHGYPDLLKTLLKKAEYRSGEDFLFILGDTLEKGPDNIGAMEYVYTLSKNPRVYVTLGNVDWWLWRLFEGDLQKALDYTVFRPDNTLSQAAKKLGSAQIDDTFRILFINKYKEEISFYKNLPCCIETEQYVFSHAGLPESGTLDDSPAVPDADFVANYNFYLSRKNHTGKTVICGHIPTYYLNPGPNFNPFFDCENDVIFIDGGTITYARQLNMLIITDKIDFITADALPKARVTKDVSGDMSGCIKITADRHRKQLDNTEVEVLEDAGDFLRVRCVNTGEEGLAKNEMLDGDLYWGELSAFLSAKKGDIVGIAKDGMSGYTYVKNAAGDMGFLPNEAIEKL